MPATTEITSTVIAESAVPTVAVPVKMSLKAELNSHLNLLQVARGHNDRRLVSRVLQHLPEVRRKLTSSSLINIMSHVSGTKAAR